VKKTFTAEEVDSIENSAYEAGRAIGRNEENSRIFSIIESLEAVLSAHKTLGVLVWTANLKSDIKNNNV
jgi:hypothetical protein